MHFLPAKITLVPNHGPYSLSREREAEFRQVKISTALPKSHIFYQLQAHPANNNSTVQLTVLWEGWETATTV